MVTNGTVITEVIAEELVASGLDVIDFSIDGPTPEIHERLRGVKGSWEETIEGVKLLHHVKKKLGVDKPSIDISYTLSKINYGLITEMVDLKSEIGYNVLHFNPVIGKTPGAKGLFLTEDDLNELEDQLGSLKDKYIQADMPLSALSRPYAVCKDKAGAKEGRYAELVNKRVLCFAPFKEVTVDPFGNVYPCSFACPFQNPPEDLNLGHTYWGEDNLCMGNIKEKSFGEIWTGEKYHELRKKFSEFGAFPMCSWCLCRSTNDAFLTGLFKDRSLLFKIILSRVGQTLRRSKAVGWEFLYK